MANSADFRIDAKSIKLQSCLAEHFNKCVNPRFHLAFGKIPLIGHVGLDHHGGNADLWLKESLYVILAQ